MNNRGFTLSELIVTIAIMGVITMIAYPAIDRLQTEHEQNLYETYEKAVQTGAKLYVDKYSRDLFVNNDAKCWKIAYSELSREGFVKDYNRKGASTRTGTVMIYRARNSQQVLYQVYVEIQKSSQIIYKSTALPRFYWNDDPDTPFCSDWVVS